MDYYVKREARTAKLKNTLATSLSNHWEICHIITLYCNYFFYTEVYPMRWSNASLMLVHRQPTLGQHLVYAGDGKKQDKNNPF